MKHGFDDIPHEREKAAFAAGARIQIWCPNHEE